MTPNHSGASAAPRPRRAIYLTVLLAMLATLAVAVPASAEPSGECSNGPFAPGVTEMQLLSGDFGLPLWLGVQIDPRVTDAPAVWVCYGTGAPGDAKLIGGHVVARKQTLTDYRYVGVDSDENSAVDVDAVVVYNVSESVVDPGGTSGGQQITVAIPFWVCAGECYPGVNGGIGATGLILGQIDQTPAQLGGISAAYSVSSLCLIVNGIPVTECDQKVELPGVTATGASPVTIGSDPGPCVVSVCLPVSPNINSVGTSGAQLATVYVPGLGPIPVYGVSTCLYRRTPSDQCAA